MISNGQFLFIDRNRIDCWFDTNRWAGETSLFVFFKKGPRIPQFLQTPPTGVASPFWWRSLIKDGVSSDKLQKKKETFAHYSPIYQYGYTINPIHYGYRREGFK